MQEYNELVTTDACNTYLEKADKNIQSVASTFSGTAFPTTNLAVGMQCMRTDDSNNIYKLTSTSPVTWELVPSKSYVDNAVTTGVKSITNFKGATSTAAGAAGLVPAPDKGTQTDYYLSADGTWKKVQQRSVKEVIDIVHPVGSIWETTTTDDPNVLWAGTTWVKMDAGRVLVSAGTYTEGSDTYTYTLGDKGGEAKHQLITDELASHGHGVSISTTSLVGDTYTWRPAEDDQVTASGVLSCSKYGEHCAGDSGKQGNGHIHLDASHAHSASISATGGNARHENRPPYETIQRWKRTA
ncbi:phage baseplate protein [Megasphaera sp.]|uniref:phage baseplate protein n=1 Tax=Megasphaera sp. TaxID=2023260 RepID=UPI004027021E